MTNLLKTAGVLVAVSLIALSASAQTCADGLLPDNIKVIGADTQAFVAELLTASETLRRQCQTIGHAANVVVTFSKTTRPIHNYRRPRLQLRRYDSGLIRAHIELPPLARADLVSRHLDRVLAQIDRASVNR